MRYMHASLGIVLEVHDFLYPWEMFFLEKKQMLSYAVLELEDPRIESLLITCSW